MSGNPTLSADTFSRDLPRVPSQSMTVQGAVNKTAILLGVLLITGAWAWQSGAMAGPMMIAGLIGGLILALITTFKAEWSPVTAPLYAACEGLVLGGISSVLNRAMPGIAMQAALLTAATLAGMLGAYTTGLLRATETFRKVVVCATAGIAIFYLISMVVGFFAPGKIAFLHGGSPLSIGISLVVVVVAALNLILDFDTIQQGARVGAPKYMEWYSAFGLLVTLVWLYLELLRLLAKLNSSRD